MKQKVRKLPALERFRLAWKQEYTSDKVAHKTEKRYFKERYENFRLRERYIVIMRKNKRTRMWRRAKKLGRRD